MLANWEKYTNDYMAGVFRAIINSDNWPQDEPGQIQNNAHRDADRERFNRQCKELVGEAKIKHDMINWNNNYYQKRV